MVASASILVAEIVDQTERCRALQRRTTISVRRARAIRSASVALRSDSGARRRQVGASLERFQHRVDVLRAWRTVPKGADAADRRTAPGVDVDLWLLHVRYARSRHPAVRAKLVDEYRGYAVSLARRLHREGEALDDLVQVAMEALLVSLDRFDPTRGVPFPALATPTILGSLKRHYRDLGWSVRVPRKVHDVAVPAREATDRLTMSLGRFPTVTEVARELGMDTETLLAAQEATHARSVSSLDAPVGEDERRADLLGTVDPGMARTENRVALQHALKELSQRERQILNLYFFEELSQSEIAARFGVSQMQVSRWLTACIRRLRDRM